ncbi:MAG: hypothetical protein DRP63_04815 [Planctomycetota bacterium]|nr:MAG: hypothetical protein DRP63_04815 [Planctomycetota bacterium]
MRMGYKEPFYKKPLRVRDPVHGFIGYDETEERVINSPVLQRLRGITQLAMTYLVYPGARHTRFEHSLGTMHVAGKMARQVGLSEDEIKLVRLAALLHDIGHGPFSHVSDVPMAVLTKEAGTLPEGVKPEKIHESITLSILLERHEWWKGVLGEEHRKRAAAILADDDMRKKYKLKEEQPILKEIVSGPVDADKLDYLLRDTLFCGVKYGVIDIERIIDCFVPFERGDERWLAVRFDGVVAIEQLVVARYQITRQVYAHRVRRIAEKMLQRAILDAKDKDEEIHTLFSFNPQEERWWKTFLKSNDHWLMSRLEAVATRYPESTCAKMSERLAARRLLKEVYAQYISRLPWGYSDTQSFFETPEQRKRMEKKIAEELGVDEALVIVDVRELKNPLHRSPEPRREGKIIVIDRNGRDQRLEDMKDSLSEKVKVESEKNVYVYVPVDESDREKRQSLYKEYRKVVEKIVERFHE